MNYTEISMHAEFSHWRQNWYHGLQAVYSSIVLKRSKCVCTFGPPLPEIEGVRTPGPPQDRRHCITCSCFYTPWLFCCGCDVTRVFISTSDAVFRILCAMSQLVSILESAVQNSLVTVHVLYFMFVSKFIAFTTKQQICYLLHSVILVLYIECTMSVETIVQIHVRHFFPGVWCCGCGP